MSCTIISRENYHVVIYGVQEPQGCILNFLQSRIISKVKWLNHVALKNVFWTVYSFPGLSAALALLNVWTPKLPQISSTWTWVSGCSTVVAQISLAKPSICLGQTGSTVWTTRYTKSVVLHVQTCCTSAQLHCVTQCRQITIQFNRVILFFSSVLSTELFSVFI